MYEGTYKGSPVAVKLLNYHIRELIAGHALRQIAKDSTVIPGGVFENSEEVMQKHVQNFQDECDRLSKLNHNNIVCHIANMAFQSW